MTLRFLCVLPLVFTYTNIEFALGILVISCAYILVTFKMTPKVRDKEKQWIKKSYKNFTMMEEYIFNFQTIHLCSADQWIKNKHMRQIDGFIAKVHNWLSEYLKVSLIQSALIFSLVAFSVLYSFFLYQHGAIELSVVVMINFLILQVIIPLENFEANFRSFVSGIIKFDLAENALQKLQRRPHNTTTIREYTDQAHDKPLIEVKDLSFYRDQKAILQGISVGFAKNTISCIAGSSGSGKSTLAKCILGLFDYTGEIRMQQGIRIGYLSQDVEIFDDSIFVNVALNDTYQLHEVEYALLKSGFSRRELKEIGSRTLGYQGLHVSGGQKRRIGIARLLYTRADVLVLDEPSSALDDQNMETLLRVIRDLCHQHTVIVITHDDRIREVSDYVFDLNTQQRHQQVEMPQV